MREITEVPGSGGYRLNTSSNGLRAAAEALLPHVKDLVDVPPELSALGVGMKAVMSGAYEPPDVESWSTAQQAALAVPTMNAVRLACEEDPSQGYAKVVGAMRLMLRVHPSVAFLAVRNSMAWEASNRPSCGHGSYDWRRVLMPLLDHPGSRWAEVFVRIRNSAF